MPGPLERLGLGHQRVALHAGGVGALRQIDRLACKRDGPIGAAVARLDPRDRRSPGDLVSQVVGCGGCTAGLGPRRGLVQLVEVDQAVRQARGRLAAADLVRERLRRHQRCPQLGLGRDRVAAHQVDHALELEDLGLADARHLIEQLRPGCEHGVGLVDAPGAGEQHRQRHHHQHRGCAVILALGDDQLAAVVDRLLGRHRSHPQAEREVAEHHPLLGHPS